MHVCVTRIIRTMDDIYVVFVHSFKLYVVFIHSFK
jgi:hypothetical protein